MVLVELRLVARNIVYSREAIRISIELGIAEELIHVAVDRIGSGFRDHVHDGTRVATILRVKCIGQDTEFSNTVRAGLHGRKVHKLIVCVATVHAEIVGTPPSAVE